MKFTAILALALALPAALATCPNDCSNNGHCNHFSACECHRNWMGNDCSMRVCYFDRAFVDTPAGDLNSNGVLNPLKTIKTMSSNVPTDEQFPSTYAMGQDLLNDAAISGWSEAHFHAECSGKGICERETGQCACFEGYEGEGCTRVACASSTEKSCSGHGTCHRLKDLYKATAAVGGYLAWDGAKTQQCVCDAGYTGLKCDQRVCPSGDDPVTKYVKYITVCGTKSDPAGIAAALDEKVYGTMTGASATVAKWADTGKPSRVLEVAGVPVARYPKCIALIAEEGLFAVGESLITQEKKYLVNNTNFVHREHSAKEQKNEIQMVVVKTQNDFGLVYTDELGAVYTTRTIKCLTADGADSCRASVEEALEELPHMVASDIDVTEQHCSKGADYVTQGACEDDSCSDDTLVDPTQTECEAAGVCRMVDDSLASPEAETTEADCILAGATKIWTLDGNVWTAGGAWQAMDVYNLQVEFVSNTGDETLMTAIGAPVVEVAAGAFVTHRQYTIKTVGDTDFTLVGAANNNIGTKFIASGAGTGTGTVSFVPVEITEVRKGTTENAICGERGICDYTTGICKCFPGFTNVDCAKQNVLAVW